MTAINQIFKDTLEKIKVILNEKDNKLFNSILKLIDMGILINNTRIERIICSAVHIHTGIKHDEQPKGIEEGFVVCGRRHSDCYNSIKAIGSVTRLSATIKEIILGSTKGKDMGFITNTNRFVYRREAMKIAIAANQLVNPKLHEGKSEDDPMFILTSEDLFLDVD